MGSVFLVIVPTRSHEFHLRLAENEIYALPATPIDPRGKVHTHNSLLNLLKIERARADFEKTGDGPPHQKTKDDVIAWDISPPVSKEVVQAYIIDHNGKLLLELSSDGMKLTHAGKVGSRAKAGSEASVGSAGSAGIIPEIKVESNPWFKWKTTTAVAKAAEATVPAGSSLGVPRSPGRRKLSSFIYKLPELAEEVELTEVIDTYFMEKHVEDALHEYELLHATWDHTLDEKFTQILFTVKTEVSEDIINHLHDVGIGKKYHSTLSVMAASIFTQETNWRKSQDSDEFDDQWGSFVQVIKSRVTVAQVVQNVKADSKITFDFTMMVVVTAIITAMGLLANSQVNVILSLLLSPIMSPVMAVTFGALIRDKALVKVGLRSGFVSLLICFLVGFIFGFVAESRFWNGPWSGAGKWPPDEMSSRGDINALILTTGIAIPSGAGIALSILSGSAGSLVGVVISGSILPPTVNCGMLYGFSLAILFKYSSELGKGCNEYLLGQHPNHTDLWRGHQKLYCDNALHEFAIMGTVSLCLTFVNIILIFLTGFLILKIKEKIRYTTRQAVSRFWKEDVQTAREWNKTHAENSLLDNIVDTRGVLQSIEEDYVFNQVKTRYPNENVLTKIKFLKKKKHARYEKLSRENSIDGGWLNWFGRVAGKGK